MKEIADFLRVHYAAVSRAVKEFGYSGKIEGLQDLIPVSVIF